MISSAHYFYFHKNEMIKVCKGIQKENKMHVDSHGYILERNSYMECIKKIAISEENTWL